MLIVFSTNIVFDIVYKYSTHVLSYAYGDAPNKVCIPCRFKFCDCFCVCDCTSPGGASLSFFFHFFASSVQSNSPSLMLSYTNVLCFRSGFLTSLILSLNIVFAVARSSEITVTTQSPCISKISIRWHRFDTVDASIDFPSLSTMYVVIFISYATFSCKVFMSSFILHAFLHVLF